MRRIIVLVLCLIILLSAIEYMCRGRVPANTYLGSRNISFFSRSEVLRLLAQEANGSLRFKVRSRVYRYQYKESGIYVDINKTLNAVFSHNTKGLLPVTHSFIGSFFAQRMVVPTVSFSDLFYAKFAQTIFDISTQNNDIHVSDQTKKLLFTDNTQKYRLDPKLLKQQIVGSIGTNVVLEPVTARISDTTDASRVLSYNQRIAAITAKPVGIVLDGEKRAFSELTQRELLSIVTVSYDQKHDNLDIGVDKNKLSDIVQGKEKSLDKGGDFTLDSEFMGTQLVTMVATRFNGYTYDFVIGRLLKKPNTDGRYAQKYIEIDISQQRMYIWESGSVIATHSVSTGLYYPTPPGKYAILNKAPNAYSDIYHVWMPYWMAFYLDPKVNAYLGIHELPYWVDVTGTQIRRPSNFIGSPHTGGCVSLDVGEAQEVYNWAQVGTAVLVYE
ncbi:MAG: L,D-transpeptidase [Candidatus Roizmanbacteria bacterium]|nr:L,D-transpeptidase [Candidatus Roizmanbacteria bacterium]